MTIPKDIRNQLAKTQGYLHKGDILRALDNLGIAACLVRDLPENKNPAKLHGLERQINALLESLCATPPLLSLLNPLPTEKPEKIQYHLGKEGALATVLRELANILREQHKKIKEMQKNQQRLQELLQKGYDLLHKREYDRGSAFLERAAQEFYTNSTVILHVADILMQHGQYLYAMKIMSESLVQHQKNEAHYLKAMEAALAMPNYAQIEHIYSLAQKHLPHDSSMLERIAQLKILAIPEHAEPESADFEENPFDFMNDNVNHEDDNLTEHRVNLEADNFDSTLDSVNIEEDSSDSTKDSSIVEEEYLDHTKKQSDLKDNE